MRRTWVCFLVILLFASLVNATQEEMLKKYIKDRKGVKAGSEYNTPEIYNETPPKTAKSKIKEIEQIKGLRPYGYDLFIEPSEEFYLPSESPVPESYTLGPGDNLIVNIWGRVEKTYNLIVDREGKAFIPKAGELTLWGLTIKQAEKKLKNLLSGIYSDFELSAVLGKIRTIKVFVYGEVKKPGAYTVSSLTTLFNILYLSGGPNARGSLRQIQLFRNKNKIKQVDLYQLLLHGTNEDVRLGDNDVVFIPVVGPSASIEGCVRRPAIYELFGGETVMDLIKLAGGLKSDSYLERVSLERIIDNSKKIILDLNLKKGVKAKDNIALKDGDRLRIFSIYDYKENFVNLKGEVKYPGMKEFKRGMRVSDIIDHGDQLLIGSYLLRANLIRTYEDLSKEIFPVNIKAVLNGDSLEDMRLQARDELMVFKKDEIRRIPYVIIEGKVKKGGSFELTKNMRLSDLLFLSGGLEKSAYLLYAEIARVDGGKPSKIVRVNLKSCLDNPGCEDDVFLKEDDRIFIREIPEWKLHELVLLEGEVKFPGRYALKKEHEMLSELITRAGGLTEKAFLRGAIFERSSIVEDLERQRLNDIMLNLQEVTADTVVQKIQEKKLNSIRTEEVKRIIVDLEKLFKEGDKSQDIELKGGDRIYLPSMPSGIYVLGAVASSGTIKFKTYKNYTYYIKQAGGMVKSADKKEIRIVKPNGMVYKKHLSRIKIELGDSIVIPKKVLKDREWLKIFTNSFTILSGALTTVFVLSRL